MLSMFFWKRVDATLLMTLEFPFRNFRIVASSSPRIAVNVNSLRNEQDFVSRFRMTLPTYQHATFHFPQKLLTER